MTEEALTADMEIDDKSAGEHRARLERLVQEYRATRKRQLLETAQKLWLRMERERARVARYEPPVKIH
jgi:hypothetical protein